MASPDTLRLHPLHDLRETAPNQWVAEGHDPQFLLDGPFSRGLWELRVRGAAPEGSGYATMQLYYAERGGFVASSSLHAGGLDAVESERRMRFWLPYRAASLRFDPSTEPGPLSITSVRMVRLNTVATFVRQWTALARADVRQAFARLLLILSLWRRDPGRAKALILELLIGGDRDRYPDWLQRRCAARAADYPFTPEAGLFSLITTVYDTAPDYVDTLARSVAAQTFADFEWLVLDNGSRDARTKAAISRLGADQRVRLFQVDSNLGIIGGMRYVLERASGRYVLPVDSDDFLFPDALAAVASYAQRHAYPPLLYTDEDKLRDGNHADPFLKPDWDPVFLRNCCYIAHLTAIDRAEALRAGVYTDPQAEGCHDWDSFLRFVRAGKRAVHVPDILYSWRMHAGSTAADVAAKDYIIDSQRHVLESHLARMGLADRLEVVRSPYFPASPDWWIRRRRVSAPALSLVIDARESGVEASVAILDRTGGYPLDRIWLITSTLDQLRAAEIAASLRRERPQLEVHVSSDGLAAALAQAAAGEAPLVAVADGSTVPGSDEWLWEMIGLKEAFPDASVIGGRVIDSTGRVLAGPQVFGYVGRIGSPDRGRAAADAGYFGSALKQQSTSAVDARLCAVDAGFIRTLTSAGAILPGTLDALGPWLGLQALERGTRVVFSPFIEAVGTRSSASPHIPATSDTRYYHRLLSRSQPFELRND